MRFKNLERKSERGNPKMTIFANGGLGPLQIVLESDTEQCASEKAEPLEGGGHEVVCEKGHWSVPHCLEKGMSVNEDIRFQVDYEIPHRLGRITKHSL